MLPKSETCELWYEDLIAKITTPKQLEILLRDIRKNFQPRNPAFTLYHPTGVYLHIGISPTWCFPHYIDEIRGYFYLKSSENGDKIIQFMLGGHYSEVSVERCIKFPEMLDIATYFVVLGDIDQVKYDWHKL